MMILATDLDRTLLPNGKQTYDGSMRLFREIAAGKSIILIYVTGRRVQLVKKAISKYKTPFPKYSICDVGTRIYSIKNRKFSEDKGWGREINKETPGWSINKFKKSLAGIMQLRLQEKAAQNRLKLSYCLRDLKNSGEIVREAEKRIKKICRAAAVVYSVDETTQTGMVDVLPQHATKLAALEYLRKKLRLKKSGAIYCGDSGNDLLPITFGYKSILVRNATPSVRKAAVNSLKRKGMLKKLYLAKGKGKLNGYYVSGIIEGLAHFGITNKKVIY